MTRSLVGDGKTASDELIAVEGVGGGKPIERTPPPMPNAAGVVT
jgi:hypothetical protein